MRLRSMGASIQERKTPCCKRSHVRAAGWMRSLPARPHRSTKSLAEGLVERHVRRLVPLAFLSPKIIQAIADGTVPTGLTVSNLTQALPHAWTAQEQMLGLS
jgi:site-specific DNA recombinase